MAIEVYLTPIGVNKFSQAAVGSIPPIVFTNGQVGSGDLGGPTPITGLSAPEATHPVLSVLVDGDQIETGFSVPYNVGDFELNEVALLDSDGDALVVGKVPPFQKHATEDTIQDVFIQVVLQHANASTVVVTTNPSANFVTYGDMEVLFSKLFKGSKHYSGAIIPANHSVDVVIDEVDTTKAFIQPTGVTGVVDGGVELNVRYEFVSGTTVRVSRHNVSGATYSGNWTANFSVIEFGNPLEQP